MVMQLSLSDIIKDAQSIQIFKGDNSYALSSFIREVEAIQALVGEKFALYIYIFYERWEKNER